MAKLRVFDAIDMLSYGSTIGEVTYFDSDILVVETSYETSYYFGNFSYADGGQWKGTIKALQVFDEGENLYYDLRGIAVSTKLATAGYSAERAIKTIFQGDDAVTGSDFDDRLAGFAGDDKVFGKDGSDILQGREGADALSGGDGDDKLSGGFGRDALTGGRGLDILVGGAKADVFEFAANSRRDVIRDFGDGKDAIWIESGADRFRDLEITSAGDNVVIAFANNEIVLRSFDVDDVSKSDFIFL